YILLEGSAELTQSPPLLVNAGQLGYTRVFYRGEAFDSLKPHLGSLPAVDQLGLLNDSWALTLAGDTPASRVVDLGSLLPVGSNPVVWDRLLGIFAELDLHYGDGPERVAYRRFVLGLLAPLAVRLGPRGSANEASNIEILRGHLLETQGRLGDAAGISSAPPPPDSRAGAPPQQPTPVNNRPPRAAGDTFHAPVAAR